MRASETWALVSAELQPVFGVTVFLMFVFGAEVQLFSSSLPSSLCLSGPSVLLLYGVNLINNTAADIFSSLCEIAAVLDGGTVCRGFEGSCVSEDLRRNPADELQHTQRPSVFDETKKPTHLILSKGG